MRHLALLTLVAAAVSHGQSYSYTNTFGTSDPTFQASPNPSHALDPLSAPVGNAAPTKAWDITTTDGSYRIAGWSSMPQSYLNSYPAASNWAIQDSVGFFSGNLAINNLPGFRISDLTSVSYQFTINQDMTAGNPSVALVTADGKSYNLFGGNSTFSVTRSGPGWSGDFIYTFSNITYSTTNQNPTDTAAADAIFTQLRFGSGVLIDMQTMKPAVGQYFDITMQSATVTLGSIPAVPEVSTYGLMLGGLALAVVAVRRRVKK